MSRLRPLVRFILRGSKRVAVSIIGFVLLLAGLVMVVLPGPGLLVIIAGLLVLSTEYAWAEVMLRRARLRARRAAERVKRRGRARS